jgi:vacuolar-type H+-ATPase subunit I/STV1
MKASQSVEDIQEVLIEKPGLLEQLEDFVQTNVKLYQYKAIDKGTEVASSVISSVIMAIFFVLGFIVLSIGLALLIGHWLGAGYYGFFIIGGFYFLLGLIVYLFRNSWIKTPLINSFSKKLLD